MWKTSYNYSFCFFLVILFTLTSCSSALVISKNSTIPTHPRSYYNQEVYIPKPKPVKALSVVSEKEIALSLPLEIDNSFSEMDLKKEMLIQSAEEYLGTPYRYGGTSRRGIDCSAFVQQVFNNNAINLPRVSRAQARHGERITLNEAEVGDLLFFATGRRGVVSHVGIVHHIEDGNVYFIHASSSQGVTVTPLSNSYWNSRYLYAKRILEEEEFNSIATLEEESISDSLEIGS